MVSREGDRTCKVARGMSLTGPIQPPLGNLYPSHGNLAFLLLIFPFWRVSQYCRTILLPKFKISTSKDRQEGQWNGSKHLQDHAQRAQNARDRPQNARPQLQNHHI